MIKKIFFGLSLLTSLISFSDQHMLATDAISGGTQNIEFKEETFFNTFDVYAGSRNKESAFVIRDGVLMNKGKYEDKILLKNPNDLDCYETSADFSSASNDYVTPIDAGIYFYAQGANESLDGIYAYEVNVEKLAFTNNVSIKIHAFDHSYVGELFEKQITATSYPINLAIQINKGDVSIYVNHNREPLLSNFHVSNIYHGQVGLRFYKSAISQVSNWKLTYKDFALNRLELDNLADEFDKLNSDSFTANSFNALKEKINYYRNYAFERQSEIDTAINEIKYLFSRLLVKRTISEFNSLLEKANEIIKNEEGKYTNNSFNSLIISFNRAKSIDLENEHNVAYFYNVVENAIKRLIKLYL